MVENPLEVVLGLHKPGRYQQANPNQPFAYDRIEDLWQETVEVETDEEPSNDDDSGEDDDDHQGGDDNNDDNADYHGDNNGYNEANNSEPNNGNGSDDTGASGPGNDNGTNNTTTVNEAQSITTATPHGGNNTCKTQSEAQNRRKQDNRKRKRPTEMQAQPTRVSKRDKKIPERFRTTNIPSTQEQIKDTQTTRAQAHKLHKRIRKSRDKLFFIKHIADTTSITRWYVVQVKLEDDDSETTRDEGIYNIWFYIREQASQ